MYDAYYGLSALPFTLTPDPTRFFESKGHRSARRYLEYRASQGEGVIVLTGEIGAGKTTLIRGLVAGLDARRVLAAQLVDTSLDAQDLLQAAALAFGVPQPDQPGADTAWQIEDFLQGLRRVGKRALLIVDEAQNLSVEGVVALHALAALQGDGAPLLQVFLVGQPELHDLVQQAWKRCAPSGSFPTYHLGPLGATETRGYIEYRLASVGWRGDPAFEPNAYALLHQISGGVPRRINALCNRLLLDGSLNETHRYGTAEVDAVAVELSRELGAYAEELRPGAAGPDAATSATHQRQDLMGPMGASLLGAKLDALERSTTRMLQLTRLIPERGAPPRRAAKPAAPKAPGRGR